jgi:hypothetical protein
MAYSSPILKSLNDFALKTYVGSKTPPLNSNFRRRLNHRPTPVSSLGNCYPDHLFHGARRLFHRIALNDAVVAAIGASSYLNLDQGDLEQDTAIQAKGPDCKRLMPAVGQLRRFDLASLTSGLPRLSGNFRGRWQFSKVPEAVLLSFAEPDNLSLSS